MNRSNITDISTPKDKARILRKMILKAKLRLFGAYARRDITKIGLKLAETKWAIVNKRHERRMAKHEKRIAEIEKALQEAGQGE